CVIRVAFRPLLLAGWQGGRSYLWNLLFAILSQPDRRLQPVVLGPPGEMPADLVSMGLETVATVGALGSPWLAHLSLWSRLLLHPNPVEELWLRRAHADVSSHSVPLGRSPIPWISWVSDLQFKVLPELFGPFQRSLRERYVVDSLRDATLVVVSSET